MKISCRAKGVTSSGKPSYSVGCDHCKREYVDLSGWIYRICRERGVEPSTQINQACQTFEWVVNSESCPDKLKRELCLCDESPVGIIGSWFRTNTRIVDDYDLNTACDQIRLYSIKDGIDPNGRDSLTAIKELRDAVKEHNKSIRAKDKK